MNLAILQIEVGLWARKNFPKAEPIDPFLGMVEELGELAHAKLKMKQGIRGTPLEHQANIEDSIADLFIFAADYCERNNLNLDTIVTRTWNQVKQRDWIKYPKNGKTE
jgi:NTP pyrophosphatase (non-canonical NTP hydrolase)